MSQFAISRNLPYKALGTYYFAPSLCERNTWIAPNKSEKSRWPSPSCALAFLPTESDRAGKFTEHLFYQV